jgi:hypothetical protein
LHKGREITQISPIGFDRIPGRAAFGDQHFEEVFYLI